MRNTLRTDARHTLYASYLAIVGQAVVNNFVPLLLLTFEGEFGISRGQVTLLLGYNFFIQLTTDFVAAFVVDHVGYRPAMVFGQLCAFLGLVCLAVLPGLVAPFPGLIIAVTLYAMGGGLVEVLVSPIVAHSPTERKAAAMSLLHSFYCWGHVFVVVLSSLFFVAFGLKNWRVLALFWAALPLFDAWYFSRVPLTQPPPQQGLGGAAKLVKRPAFWFLFMMMVCSGASEHSVVQWASTYIESSLHISKTLGDLLGPTVFAVLMGLARVLHARHAERHSMRKYLMMGAVLCALCYAVLALSAVPWLSLLAVGITGFSVGLFWPGTLSLAPLRLPMGGTAMYALLALAGDVGCSVGPWVVGFGSQLFQGSFRAGFALALIFPLGLVALLALWRGKKPA